MLPSSRDVVAPIDTSTDIVRVRERGRALAGTVGFSITERVLIVTAISELARNILAYAVRGKICVRVVQSDSGKGIGVVATDEGPGIDNVDRALTDGFSTSGGLGLGLPGVRRLMDDFQIESRAGEGTTVRVTKWLSDGHKGGTM